MYVFVYVQPYVNRFVCGLIDNTPVPSSYKTFALFRWIGLNLPTVFLSKNTTSGTQGTSKCTQTTTVFPLVYKNRVLHEQLAIVLFLSFLYGGGSESWLVECCRSWRRMDGRYSRNAIFHFDLLVFAKTIIVVYLILYFMYILCSRSKRNQCMVFNTIYFNYSVI